MTTPGIFPFERPFSEVEADLDAFVEAVIGSLESSFLAMPKGKGFVEYPAFANAYEVLKKATHAFANLTCEKVSDAIRENPLAFIVLRAMLGFTPPEWAYVASQDSGQSIGQGFARSIDRRIRLAPTQSVPMNEKTQAMINAACRLLEEGARNVGDMAIHRLDKSDTRTGKDSLVSVSKIGVPYAMLLYERVLGRPFASHRDSVSELVGDYMELPVEETLTRAGISFRKTKRAERVTGFEQAPDFIIPDEFTPRLVIEAKITEDDGTARDKVTRIQHLATLSRNREEEGQQGFEVIACIDGRGFGIRREDVKKVIRATRGKVFTLATLHRLVETTSLKDFKTT